MSKNIFKYVSVLALLFFTGISNLHANNTSHSQAYIYNQSSKISANKHVELSSRHNRNTSNLVFETVEVDEIENEESPSKHYQTSFHNFLNEVYKFIAFNEVKQSQKASYYNKKYQDKASTKLHVRLQVFII